VPTPHVVGFILRAQQDAACFPDGKENSKLSKALTTEPPDFSRNGIGCDYFYA
jgi:hypothetical protein